MSKARIPWWRGERGEWYEVLQFVLLFLIVFGPFTLPGSTRWPGSTDLLRVSGISLIVGSVGLGAVSLKQLRSSLTPMGGLKADGALVTNGPYRVVRHPLYLAQILFGVGWSFTIGGWLTTLCALALGVLLNFKAALEERRLLQRFPAYGDYQSHTWRFFPLIY